MNFDEQIEREAIDYLGIFVKAVLILGGIFFGGSFVWWVIKGVLK